MSLKSNLRFCLLGVLLLGACSLTTWAQTKPPPPQAKPPEIPSSEPKTDSSDDKTGLGSIDEELRVKRQIKLAEKQYKENVERAREVAGLGAELYKEIEDGKTFGEKETKKLERLEKLTKKIRTEAGGSDEEDLISNPPRKLEAALSRLAEVSASLCSTVEKTPRQVISAAVIQQANAVLQLTRLARRLF